jgi:hypothetical protein
MTGTLVLITGTVLLQLQMQIVVCYDNLYLNSQQLYQYARKYAHILRYTFTSTTVTARQVTRIIRRYTDFGYEFLIVLRFPYHFAKSSKSLITAQLQTMRAVIPMTNSYL